MAISKHPTAHCGSSGVLFSLPKKISKGLKYNIKTIFSEILGNVSEYLMLLIISTFILLYKRKISNMG